MEREAGTLFVLGCGNQVRERNLACQRQAPLDQVLGQLGDRIVVDFRTHRTRRGPVGGEHDGHADRLDLLVWNEPAREGMLGDLHRIPRGAGLLQEFANLDGENRRRTLPRAVDRVDHGADLGIGRHADDHHTVDPPALGQRSDFLRLDHGRLSARRLDVEHVEHLGEGRLVERRAGDEAHALAGEVGQALQLVACRSDRDERIGAHDRHQRGRGGHCLIEPNDG